MPEPKEEILHRSSQMFERCGFRAVTMDDVSQECRMSKKTLYQLFKNKSDLVEQSVKRVFKKKTEEMLSIEKAYDNAIDAAIAQNVALNNTLEGHIPSMMFALRKYYSRTYEWLVKVREDVAMDMMKDNLERGVEQGLYRQDLHIEHASTLRFLQVISLMEMQSLSQSALEREKLLKESLDLYMRSITTPQGMTYFRDQFQSQFSQS